MCAKKKTEKITFLNLLCLTEKKHEGSNRNREPINQLADLRRKAEKQNYISICYRLCSFIFILPQIFFFNRNIITVLITLYYYYVLLCLKFRILTLNEKPKMKVLILYGLP